MEQHKINTFVKVMEKLEELQHQSLEVENVISTLFDDFQGILKIGTTYEKSLIEIGAAILTEDENYLPSVIDWIEWFVYEAPDGQREFNVISNGVEYSIKTYHHLASFILSEIVMQEKEDVNEK